MVEQSFRRINYEGALTLRTSFFGHQIDSDFSLLQWFLKQKGSVMDRECYILRPSTVEIASIHMKYVILMKKFMGYHLSSEPVSKYELLRLLRKFMD